MISLARLIYKKNTLFKNVPGLRCCSNCHPDQFPMEEIELEKKPGLKRGRRTTVSEEFRKYVRERLRAWRSALLDRLYPEMSSVPTGMVMHNDVIDKLASQGKRISSAADLLSRVRWGFGIESVQDPIPVPNQYCRELFIELQDIYKEYDEAHPEDKDTEDELNEGEAKAMGGSRGGGGGGSDRRTAVASAPQIPSSSSQLQFINKGPSDYSATQ